MTTLKFTHLFLSGFVFGDMKERSNLCSVGGSSIRIVIVENISGHIYHIKKIFHWYYYENGGRWGTFWCQKLLVVSVLRMNSNQKSVGLGQRQPGNTEDCKRLGCFDEWWGFNFLLRPLLWFERISSTAESDIMGYSDPMIKIHMFWQEWWGIWENSSYLL